jgi:hypothetical protein
MRKSRRLLLVAAGLLVWAAPTFAAGWALSVDTPLSYAFDKGNANQNSQGASNQATWNHRSTDNVSGSKVLLIAPFHLGVGYEDYTVGDTITIPNGNGSTSQGNVKANFQIADAVVDLPMRWLNLGLGYGSGQVNTTIVSQSTITARHADVSQTFVTLGIPLGKSLDVHVGYHWVSVEKKEFQTGGQGTNQILLSGEMLSAGLRFNF